MRGWGTDERLKRRRAPHPVVALRTRRHRAAPVRGDTATNRRTRGYGVVVDNVSVSVLAYVPVRSGSLAAMDCLNSIGAESLATGPV